MSVLTPFESIEQAVLDRYRLQIASGGDGGSMVPSIDPNEPESPPTSGPFVDVSVVFSRSAASVGAPTARRKRSVGIAYFGVNVALGTGKKSAREIATRIDTAFSEQTIAGIVFRTAQPQNGSGERSGGFWRLVVGVPFYADDFA